MKIREIISDYDLHRGLIIEATIPKPESKSEPKLIIEAIDLEPKLIIKAVAINENNI